MSAVPLHPEAVPGDPSVLRWVVPPGTLPFVGAPTSVPAPLQALLDDATLVEVLVEPDAVRLRLDAACSWRTEGAHVREALQAALGTAPARAGWLPPGGATSDDVLRMAVEQVIAGDVGDYVRGHGGRVSVVEVRDGRVEVSLGGACTHCPGSDSTLTERFETAVRARCPEVREVVAADEPGFAGLAGGRRLLGLLTRR